MNNFSAFLDDNQDLFFSKLLLRETGMDYHIHDSQKWIEYLKLFLTEKDFDTVNDLIEQLKRDDKNLLTEFLSGFKINIVSFFQNVDQIKYFHDMIIPQFNKMINQNKEISIWCTGSSTGEEAYSFSIMLDLHLKKMEDWILTVLGTDIDSGNIETAIAAIYSQQSFQNDIAQNLSTKYFKKMGENYHLKNQKIRGMTHFLTRNLLDENHDTQRYDIICCRNHLKQFTPELRSKIFNNFIKKLKPGGHLFLNKTDSPLGIDNHFINIKDHPGIYQLTE